MSTIPEIIIFGARSLQKTDPNADTQNNVPKSICYGKVLKKWSQNDPQGPPGASQNLPKTILGAPGDPRYLPGTPRYPQDMKK